MLCERLGAEDLPDPPARDADPLPDLFGGEGRLAFAECHDARLSVLGGFQGFHGRGRGFRKASGPACDGFRRVRHACPGCPGEHPNRSHRMPHLAGQRQLDAAHVDETKLGESSAVARPGPDGPEPRRHCGQSPERDTRRNGLGASQSRDSTGHMQQGLSLRPALELNEPASRVMFEGKCADPRGRNAHPTATSGKFLAPSGLRRQLHRHQQMPIRVRHLPVPHQRHDQHRSGRRHPQLDLHQR